MKLRVTIEVPGETTATDRYPYARLDFKREITIEDLDKALEITLNISAALTLEDDITGEE